MNNEIHRVLNPGGRLVAVDFGATPREGIGHLLWVLRIRTGWDHAERLRAMLHEAGFATRSRWVHWSSCPGLRAGMEAACGARLASQVDGRLRCQRPGIDNPPHSLCKAVGFPRRPLGCEFGRLRSRLACVTSKEGRDRPSRARSPTEFEPLFPQRRTLLPAIRELRRVGSTSIQTGLKSSQRFRPGGLMKTSTDGVDSRRPSPPGKMLS